MRLASRINVLLGSHLFSCYFSTALKKSVLLDTDLHTSDILQHIALNL